MPDDPPPTLEYRSGLEEPATDWRGGFVTLELLLENLLGIVFGVCGAFLAAFGIYILFALFFAHHSKQDTAAGLALFCFFTVLGGVLLFLAWQFIGTRPRR